MKGERTPKNRKVLSIIGLTAAVCGVLSVALGFFFLDSDESIGWVVCFGVAIFCLAIEFPALVKAAPTVEEQLEQMTALHLTVLSGLSEKSFLQTFQYQGFRFLNEKILAKRGLLGVVSYYAHWITIERDIDVKTLVDTIDAVIHSVEMQEQRDPKSKRGNICLLLFLELNQASEAIEQCIRVNSAVLRASSFLRPFQQKKALVSVLVDKTSGQGRFWLAEKGINVYTCGCRLLKKYFT